MRVGLAWRAPATAFGAGGGQEGGGGRGEGSRRCCDSAGGGRVRCLCLVSNVTVSTAPGRSPGGPWGPGDIEGGMGQQLDRRSCSVAKATTAKNTAGHCHRQQSHWRIFSIISVAISSATLPGSAVPTPPRALLSKELDRACHLPLGASVSLLHTVLWCHPPSHCCHPTSSTPQRALSCHPSPLYTQGVPCP